VAKGLNQAIFFARSREQARVECDWLVMASSVFVASQSYQVAFFSVRANRFAWWITGLSDKQLFTSKKLSFIF
jgi:hypothetical protein